MGSLIRGHKLWNSDTLQTKHWNEGNLKIFHILEVDFQWHTLVFGRCFLFVLLSFNDDQLDSTEYHQFPEFYSIQFDGANCSTAFLTGTLSLSPTTFAETTLMPITFIQQTTTFSRSEDSAARAHTRQSNMAFIFPAAAFTFFAIPFAIIEHNI